MVIVLEEELIEAFKKELKKADAYTFPICVDSFTNLWMYEFGSLDNLPKEMDHLISYRGYQLGLLEEM